MKKFLKIALTAVLCFLTLATLTTLAACKCNHEYVDGKCVKCGEWVITEGVEYALTEDGNSYGVVGFSSKAAAEVYILPEYNGKPVTTIFGNAFTDSNIVSVNIPDSVTTIEGCAFAGCEKLTGVYITDIAVWCNIKFSGYSSNPLSYSTNLYLNGELVTNLVVSDGVTSIGNYAFSGCSSLTSITIPDSVTSIGDSAFYVCSGLTSITLPDSVTSIGYGAFEGCIRLTSISIPDSVTSIEKETFHSCSGLTSIMIPDSVTSIGKSAFV